MGSMKRCNCWIILHFLTKIIGGRGVGGIFNVFFHYIIPTRWHQLLQCSAVYMCIPVIIYHLGVAIWLALKVWSHPHCCLMTPNYQIVTKCTGWVGLVQWEPNKRVCHLACGLLHICGISEIPECITNLRSFSMLVLGQNGFILWCSWWLDSAVKSFDSS